MSQMSQTGRGRHVAPAQGGGRLWMVDGLSGPEVWRPERLLWLLATALVAVGVLAAEVALSWRLGHTTGLVVLGAGLVAAVLVQALTGAEEHLVVLPDWWSDADEQTPWGDHVQLLYGGGRDLTGAEGSLVVLPDWWSDTDDETSWDGRAVGSGATGE